MAGLTFLRVKRAEFRICFLHNLIAITKMIKYYLTIKRSFRSLLLLIMQLTWQALASGCSTDALPTYLDAGTDAKWNAITSNTDYSLVYTAGSSGSNPFAASFSTSSYSYEWTRHFSISTEFKSVALDRNQAYLALVGV